MVRGGLGVFIIGEQLLVELLPRPQAHELDRDLAYLEAGELDHVVREVDDAHGLAHVQHEDLTARAHQAGLHHKLRRLRDGHEVAGDLGVGDSDRSARGDLLPKFWDDAAAAAQDVTEADHDETRTGLILEPLDDHLSEALAGPHDVGGVDGLVGRDQHELGHAGPLAGPSQRVGTEDVVEERLGDVVGLHERDVLVGRGVEHDPRGIFSEEPLEPLGVLDVTDDGEEFDGQALKLLLKLIECVFREVIADEQPRRIFDDLAAELGADRAAGPSDQHHLTIDQFLQAGLVEVHRVTPQQVLHVNRS